MDGQLALGLGPRRVVAGTTAARGGQPLMHGVPLLATTSTLVQHGGRLIRALCVIAWNEEQIRPWVTAVRPTVLGDGSAWEELTPALDPVVVEAMRSLTLTINHNNTIAAGFEKDQVVSTLLALHNARIAMDGEALQGWALANGWSGRNPQRLAQYVDEINAGKRPRCRRVLRADYVETLRRRAETGQ
jgi:hypothetical protein